MLLVVGMFLLQEQLGLGTDPSCLACRSHTSQGHCTRYWSQLSCMSFTYFTRSLHKVLIPVVLHVVHILHKVIAQGTDPSCLACRSHTSQGHCTRYWSQLSCMSFTYFTRSLHKVLIPVVLHVVHILHKVIAQGTDPSCLACRSHTSQGHCTVVVSLFVDGIRWWWIVCCKTSALLHCKIHVSYLLKLFLVPMSTNNPHYKNRNVRGRLGFPCINLCMQFVSRATKRCLWWFSDFQLNQVLPLKHFRLHRSTPILFTCGRVNIDQSDNSNLGNIGNACKTTKKGLQ